jgi:hypothetical protein
MPTTVYRTVPVATTAAATAGVPRGWYWLGALGLSLGLWWLIIHTALALIGLV